MPHIPGLEAAENLLTTFAREHQLYSTGAEVVDYSGELYNVTGSTPDPAAIPGHEHVTWKTLLKDMAELDDETTCYVSNVLPPASSSHPAFKVGGHMTPNASGVVEQGGICYLMPLCSWHNSTARDGMAFEHTETKMLKLSGFMLGDSPSTFRLRQHSHEPYALLFFDEDATEWKTHSLPTDELSTIQELTRGANRRVEPPRVLLQRIEDRLYIKDSALPKP